MTNTTRLLAAFALLILIDPARAAPISPRSDSCECQTCLIKLGLCVTTRADDDRGGDKTPRPPGKSRNRGSGKGSMQ